MIQTIDYATAKEQIMAAGRELVQHLSGSDKQQGWAVRIIWQTLGEHAELMPRLTKGVARDVCNQIVAKLSAHTSAAWWIDNRGHNGVALKSLLAN